MLRKVIFFLIYKIFYKFFWIFPIKKNRVLFSSYFGRNYSDSPRFLFEELIKHRSDLDIIWVQNRENSELKEKNVKLIGINTWQYLYYSATSAYWIDNCHGYHLREPRKETVYLQTWHGTPLKKIAQDIEGEQYEVSRKSWEIESGYWDYLISPSTMLNKLFSKAFKVSKNIMINAMYPRNEFLIGADREKIREKVIEILGINPKKKNILYAPTFRLGETENYGIKFSCEKLKRELGEDYNFLVRVHPNVKVISPEIFENGYVIDASKYDDIQELYAVTDILITDYSSVFFDFAILKKPMIFYPYDFEKYRDDDRGFYFPYEETVPGPICRDEDGVIEEIENVKKDTEKFIEHLDQFNKKFNDTEFEGSSEKILKKIGLL
ncbi:MAG: CDP-glycerol glycerophosphotransferase family protein [Fusobacteriaceae bacterium]